MNSIFSVAQFNILCESLASPGHFPASKKENLLWDNRKYKIIENIKNLSLNGKHVDILCAEELSSYWEFFKDELEKEPFYYNSCFVKRPSIRESNWSGKVKLDGCGIFYSSKKFRLIRHHSINFNDTHDRVGLILLLEFIGEYKNNGYIIIASTHLYWNIKKINEQINELKEVEEGINSLLTFSKTELGIHSNIPVILAGDFNNIPNSPVYRYMLDNFLSNTHCMKSSYSNYLLNQNKEQEEPEINGKYEPLTTSVTHKRSHTIDYIFYSYNYLRVDSLQKLPTEDELRSEEGDEDWKLKLKDFVFEKNKSYNGIPNSQWGSDHIPIAASFKLL